MEDFSLYKNAGILIRNLRRNRKLSGKNLGDILGISQQQVSRYEQGETELTLRQISRISAVFNMTVWDFINILYFMSCKKIESKKKEEKDILSDFEYDKMLWWNIQ